MTKKTLVFLAVVATSAWPGVARAQIIPSDRTTTWNPGIPGGIPNRTTICSTLSPSGVDDTNAINNALASCPANQVVKLNSGTFKISGNGIEITKSNVTLRGSGPAATKLVKKPGSQISAIAVGTRWYTWMQPTALTTDAVKGNNSIQVSKIPSGLAVGELVHVDETYDPSLTYYNPSTQSGDYQGWGEGRQGPQSASRPIGQAMEIASITGTGPYTITFTTPFHINFRVNHAAHMVRIGNGASVVPTVKNVGIEDLYVSNGEGGDGGGNILFFATAYSWARNVESDKSQGGSFVFDGSFRCVLRDSYLHSTIDPNPGGAGYGIVVDTYSADNLIENNISWNFNKVMAMRSSGGGNVIGYNYMDDAYGGSYPVIVEVGMNASHMTTPHMELFEGNESFNFDSDSYWGNSIYITVFRNHFTARRRTAPPLDKYTYTDSAGNHFVYEDDMNRRAIGLTNNIWWFNFVGNVLGTAGQTLVKPRSTWSDGSLLASQTQFTYEMTGDMSSDTIVPMWKLGYNGQDGSIPQDQTVVQRTLRQGNFDYVSNSVRWDTTAQAIPNSLYLTAKPAFFGSNQWPWVDATGATKLYTLPARQRFEAIVSGGSVPTAPAAPTNLRVIK